VGFDVSGRGLFGVTASVALVAMREVGVMSGFFVIAGLMMPRGLPMVTSGVFVMFGSFVMMLGNMFRHRSLQMKSRLWLRQGHDAPANTH
jgi:hypothetical protein